MCLLLLQGSGMSAQQLVEPVCGHVQPAVSAHNAPVNHSAITSAFGGHESPFPSASMPGTQSECPRRIAPCIREHLLSCTA